MPAMNENTVRIRLVRPEDTSAMLAIYSVYVRNTAVSFETETPTPAEFSQRIQTVMQKYPCLVAEENGRIIGYAYANPFKTRAAYNWAVETTIYLHADSRRKGVGRKLYSVLEQILSAQGICNVNACIGVPRTENDPFLTMDSIRFHTRMGYRMVGEFDCCGSKFGRWYNMAWMEKHIGSHPDHPAPVKWFPEIRAQFESICPDE